ncbi:Nucleic acid-binding proteins superfamily [Striga hermonthica]|uniref:Nucleic acid-binding proteins superfamily n=1 Tax=Striga hermonthica TaxID=68872 RepID=A0A9N7R7I6_STRHE|nr:Nucleic acid-binding proteins superfamily [Striga hermonthica]
MFIVDDTGIMQVLCWDKVANELIGKTCEEVVQNVIKHEDGSDLPTELSTLKDKALLFKVGRKKDQLRPYNGAFTVSRITADPILVHRFGVLANAPQEGDCEQGELNSPLKTRIEPVNDTYNSEPKRKVSDESSKGKKKIKIEEI